MVHSHPATTSVLSVGYWKNLWRESGLGQGDSLNCMFQAFLCEHVSVNLNDWRFCCATTCECLCIRHTACCLRGAPFKPVQFGTHTTRGEYCRLSFPCCDCAIIPPRLLCGRASQVLCMHNTGALPFDDEYLPAPVCAYYFIACAPRLGCCVAPPRSRALEALVNVGFDRCQVVTAPDGEEMDRTYAAQSAELVRKQSDDNLQMVV
jgi:hypothetical protein